jgi:hypothetical protein
MAYQATEYSVGRDHEPESVNGDPLDGRHLIIIGSSHAARLGCASEDQDSIRILMTPSIRFALRKCFDDPRDIIN